MIRRALRTLREIDPIAIVAIFVLLLGAGQLVAGALSTGVTIDEPIEVEETQSWIGDGWYLPGYLLVDGKPDPNNELASPYVYGPAFGATAHLANLVLGNEPSDEISDSAASYDVRHLLTALLAAIAVGAVGLAVWRLTGSLRFALWAAAGLLAVPAWTGHGFFNPKDIPGGCGYTLVTVALLLALAETTRARPPAWRRLGIAALLAGGTFIGAGTRLTLLVPLLLSLLVYAALRLAQRQLGKVDTGRSVDVAVAAGAI